MMQIQNSKSETPFSCSEFYELWSFRISDFGFRICLEGGLVPSDDFWADLPSEKAKNFVTEKGSARSGCSEITYYQTAR